MLRYVVMRLVSLLPTMFLATVIVFGLVQLVPGDAAITIAGDSPTAKQIEFIRNQLHLNDSLIEQYKRWLSGVLHGDLGQSFVTRQPVAEAIQRRLPATMHLVVAALFIAVLLGVATGILAAAREGSKLDAVVSAFATFGIAIPSFWLGLMLVSGFAIQLSWLPSIGYVSIFESPNEAVRHLILPAITLGVAGAAEVSRQVRSAMIEVLNSDAIRTHQSKGLSRGSIVWKHGVRNAGVPIATVIGLLVSRLIGATVVVEAVFGIPGLGTLVVQAALSRDFPVIQGVVLVLVVLVLVTNFIVDVSYRLIDPRVKL